MAPGAQVGNVQIAIGTKGQRAGVHIAALDRVALIQHVQEDAGIAIVQNLAGRRQGAAGAADVVGAVRGDSHARGFEQLP